MSTMFLDQLIEQKINLLRTSERVSKEMAESKMKFDLETWRNAAYSARGKGQSELPQKPVAPLVMKFDEAMARQFERQINQGIQPPNDYFWYERAEWPENAFDLDKPAYPEPKSPIGDRDIGSTPGEYYMEALGDTMPVGSEYTDPATGKEYIKVARPTPFGPSERWKKVG